MAESRIVARQWSEGVYGTYLDSGDRFAEFVGIAELTSGRHPRVEAVTWALRELRERRKPDSVRTSAAATRHAGHLSGGVAWENVGGSPGTSAGEPTQPNPELPGRSR